MEIMEEGNVMDRVRVLLQRDFEYYQSHQTVLQENLCPGVVGGLLDFPHYASFAAVKMALWWEEEYVAAFSHPSGLLEFARNAAGSEQVEPHSVAKTSGPKVFFEVVTSSSKQLLEHLHTLSQEALDHADLTVLTGTLGAASLIKNVLWCYNEQLRKSDCDSETLSGLHDSYKKFQEMAEALAERLLDLHCRLLSLYVLQDSDCLNWEHQRPFFEGERGSFVIQMWWLYMQGTREDLWNTVPPKMAQRVLAGMLNESLTILTARYTQAMPSSARSSLLVVDISNILLCVCQILPSICNDSEELKGLSKINKVSRDIHAKCHELLCCLLLRGCPLATLYKTFRKGMSGIALFTPCNKFVCVPWYIVTSPHLFNQSQELSDEASIALELMVLTAQPQASWPLLLKVLMMRHCKVASIIMKHYMNTAYNLPVIHSSPAPNKEISPEENETGHCNGFLCSGLGECRLGKPTEHHLSSDLIIFALVHIVSTVGGPTDLSNVILSSLEKTSSKWSGCLDHRQVWNQARPTWLDAILKSVEPALTAVIDTLLCAIQGGSKPHEATNLALECLCHIIDCLPATIFRAAALLEDALPADIHPVGDSVLLQLLVLALYSQLTITGGNSVTALSESLCNLGLSNKYNLKVEEFISIARESAVQNDEDYILNEAAPHMEEVLVSKLLFTLSGRSSLKIMWQFLQYSSDWVLGQLNMLESKENFPSSPHPIPAATTRPSPAPLLHTMFHIGSQHFDQLLAGSLDFNWSSILNMQLGLTPDHLWSQLSKRSEFRDSPEMLSEHDSTVVTSLSALFGSS